MQNHEEHQGTSKKTRSKFDLLERLGTMVSRPNSMISIYVCAVQLDLSCTLLTVMSQNWLRYQETTTASKAQTSGSGWEGMDWSTYVVYFTSPKRGEDRHVPRSHPILDSCKPFPCARVWHSLTIAPQGLARHQPHVLSVHVVELMALPSQDRLSDSEALRAWMRDLQGNNGVESYKAEAPAATGLGLGFALTRH